MKKLKLTTISLLLFILFFSACTENNTVEDNDLLKMDKEEALKIINESQDKSKISKEVWKLALDEEDYEILWEKGTERPFTGELLEIKEKGVYLSKGCDIPVFSSEHKFESGTGWPSFTKAIDDGNIILKEDRKFGIKRTEVLSKCGEHLGHLFNDGPKEQGGKRFCINSKALKFVADKN